MTSNFFTAGEVQAARQQKLKGVQNAQSWGCFFGMLGCWCSFDDFCWISFWISFWLDDNRSWSLFFWWSTPWFRFKGSQYLQNWVVLLLWAAFLLTFFVFEHEWFSEAFAMADDDHDDEELHWTSLNTDWCGSRGTVQPCSPPTRIGPYLLTPGASEKRVGKESEVKVGAMEGVSLWRCDVFFSNARQGVQIKLVWSPVHMDGTVPMAAIRDNRWGDNFS